MAIEGMEGLSAIDLRKQVEAGGRFVVFSYTMSFLLITLRRSSGVVYVGPGESVHLKGLPYTLLSLVLGWWGIPWGFIYTPMSLYHNLRGGQDVTAAVLAAIEK